MILRKRIRLLDESKIGELSINITKNNNTITKKLKVKSINYVAPEPLVKPSTPVLSSESQAVREVESQGSASLTIENTQSDVTFIATLNPQEGSGTLRVENNVIQYQAPEVAQDKQVEISVVARRTRGEETIDSDALTISLTVKAPVVPTIEDIEFTVNPADLTISYGSGAQSITLNSIEGAAFAVESRLEGVVRTNIQGNTLEVTPLAIGNTVLSITASKEGFNPKTIKVSVKVQATEEISFRVSPLSTNLAINETQVLTIEGSEDYTFEVNDKISYNKDSKTITALANGIGVLTLTAGSLKTVVGVKVLPNTEESSPIEA